jgi:hypothetical protein
VHDEVKWNDFAEGSSDVLCDRTKPVYSSVDNLTRTRISGASQSLGRRPVVYLLGNQRNAPIWVTTGVTQGLLTFSEPHYARPRDERDGYSVGSTGSISTSTLSTWFPPPRISPRSGLTSP